MDWLSREASKLFKKMSDQGCGHYHKICELSSLKTLSVTNQQGCQARDVLLAALSINIWHQDRIMALTMIQRSLLAFILLFVSQTTLARTQSCESLFLTQTKHQIAVNLALNAGLVYGVSSDPGISRMSIADPKTKSGLSYVYYDSNSKPIRDPETLARINSLKIPPAYTHVWIASDPLAHIQARGTDSRQRPQYRYHELWTKEVLAPAKFNRMKEFGAKIADLRAAVERDLTKSEIDENSRIAAIVRLLETAGIRVGGDKYTQGEAPSFGLATLTREHLVELIGPRMRFKFVAKEGIPQDITVKDPQIARLLNSVIKGKSPEEKLFDVSSSDVNQYIKNQIGNSFSAKDFRTWVGTTQAASTLQRLGSQEIEEIQQEAISVAAQEASARLHNTPDTALKYYIAPSITKAYLSGELDAAFLQVIDTRLSPAENAVLFLSNK